MKINLENIPQLPGVYIFKDIYQKPIYIGKAKSLRKRVCSYFNVKKSFLDWKINELVKEYTDIEFIVTKTEEEAILLEADLIKTFQPKYNVLLKHGNPFSFLMISKVVSDDFVPELKLVHNKKEPGLYFGPFINKKDISRLLNYLQRSLQLKLCKHKIKSGCLDFHLGLCAGICLDNFDLEGYKFKLNLAYELLSDNFKTSEKLLKDKIEVYNNLFEFEKSKNLKDILDNLQSIFRMIKLKFSIIKYDKEFTALATPISYKLDQYNKALIDLQKLLNLKDKPEKIDCFDISHFQSSHLVGSCVRFTNGIPDKNYFRRFKIRTIQEQNDYAALREIVSRRYSDNNSLPDVILIDGGRGQLNSVKDLFPNITFISLAKKEETLITDSKEIKLDIKSEMGQLLIALRDYTHHFAITYHKFRRHKNLFLK